MDETIRSWALKCGTAFGQLNEEWAKEIFETLYQQLFANQADLVCTTVISGIFELIDHYDHGFFGDEDASQWENSQVKLENGDEPCK